MTTSVAKGYVEQAGESIDAAGDALRRGNIATATREAQLTVELAVKASLYEVGVEPPRDHDIHVFLLRHRTALPPAWQRKVGEWAEAMGELSLLRARAWYGDPREGRTAREMFSDREETERLVEMARSVYRSVQSFLRKQ